eukprot:Tbor_TRINITY_DN5548_c0_g2::TRINITY_DN5548_c0_g2_i1::g.13880::m.13880
MSYDPVFSLKIVERTTKSIFVGHQSGIIQQYRLADLKGLPIATLEGHTDCVTAILPQPDSDGIYSLSLDKTIRLWNIEEDDDAADSVGIIEAAGTVKKTPLVKTILTNSGIRCGVFCGDSLRCGGSDGCIYTLREGDSVDNWIGHKDAISCMASSKDTLLVSGSYDNQLRIWSAASGRCLFLLMGHTNQVKCVEFVSGEDVVMSSGRDETLRMWILPEFSEDEDNADDSGMKNDDMDDEEDGNTSSYAPKPTTVPRIVRCCSIVKLPSAPLCLISQDEENHSRPLTYIGASGGDIYSIAAGKFHNIVKSYLACNQHDLKAEMRRLNKHLKNTINNEKRVYKKSVKALKNRLKTDQKDEKRKEAIILKNQRRQEAAEEKKRLREEGEDADEEDEEDNDHNDEDEDGDENEETYNEEEEEAEEGNEMETKEPVDKFPYTEERRAELDQFTAEAKRKMDTAIEKVESTVSERSKKLRQLEDTKYEKNEKQFYSIPFIRVFKHQAEESVTAIAVDGFNVVVPSGSTKRGVGVVIKRNCTPGHEF